MKRKGIRLNTVVLVSIIGTVVLVLLTAMVLFYRTYRSALLRNAETAGLRTVAQVSSTVNNYLSNIDSVMDSLSGSFEGTDSNQEEFFDVFLRIRPDVIAVSTYDRDGVLLDCFSQGHTLFQPIENNLSMDSARIRQEPDGYLSAPHVNNLFEGYYPWCITMVKPLHSQSGFQYVALDISFSGLSDYINDVGIGQRGYCFLMDRDGNIIYHPQQQLIYSSLKNENTVLISSLPDGSHAEGGQIYTIQSIPRSGWKIIGVSFVQDLISESLVNLERILALSAFLIVLATIVISSVLSRALSRPIQDLGGAMREFEADADSFSYHPAGGAREVQSLSESFSHMVLRIQELMNRVRQEELNLRKTELRALQAQINPHFLYNTLDSISWMCEQGKNAEAVQMVNSLARLFRISISKGNELIPVRSELEHAESYLQIQSHRYKNQFRYSFDVDPACLDYFCNKITLQPIIENAIYHGINGLVDEDGEIRVSVRMEGDDIVFTVSDNGTGMTEEQIQAIMHKERSDSSGIGIKNVNDRLKIFFGSPYGISIDSVPDEGTSVHIRMPKIQEGDYEK